MYILMKEAFSYNLEIILELSSKKYATASHGRAHPIQTAFQPPQIYLSIYRLSMYRFTV